MIEIKQLSHRYSHSEIPTLNKLDFTIESGLTLGLLGPNGAGKTTLMSLLAGLQKVQQGQILFNGIPAEQLNKQQRHQISLVPQDFAFYPLLTVWENLKFFASLYDIYDKKYLLSLLDKVDLIQYKNKLAKFLSGGLKRRLNFAIGLINQPRIIFLDEITVGIDPESRLFILQSVRELHNQGVTIIYTSHYLQEIEQLCQKIILLNQGNLIFQGEIDKVLKKEGKNSLESFYLDFLNQSVEDKC